MSLQDRFYSLLMKSGCVPVGSRVLVAVSGGADSVALLSLLHSVAEPMELHLEVAHLDHSLRDVSSADAHFVEQLAAGYALPATIKRLDVAEIARKKKGNLEEIARDLRREFLLDTAKHRQCDVVALGQHLDDQAETFMMRLMRGSGISGLSCMREREGSIVRPMLSFSREEIVSYLKEAGLSWREDDSNSDLNFTRNRIRHQLMPLLETFNPNVSRQLYALSGQMQNDDDFWSRLVEGELTRCGEWREGCYALRRRAVCDMSVAMASRVVRAALLHVRGNLRGISSTHIDDVLQLFNSDSPQGELNLPDAWVAARYEEVLVCCQEPDEVPAFDLVIDKPGVFSLPGGSLSVAERAHSLGESNLAVEFAAAGLSFPLRVRSCQPGDRLQPSGMKGSKKIQDLFVDLKLTKEERRRALLLVNDCDLLWVIGVRRSSLFSPGNGETVLRFELKP